MNEEEMDFCEICGDESTNIICKISSKHALCDDCMDDYEEMI